MGSISERMIVQCPDREAAEYLAAFVAEHRASDGTVRIALQLPISFRDRRPPVERRVVTTLYPLQSAGSAHPTYSVTWLPKGDGPSPEFAGALAVETSGFDDSFGLILSGYYTPFGEGCAISDATHGRRIAHVSARDVLRAIADYVETARAHRNVAQLGAS